MNQTIDAHEWKIKGGGNGMFFPKIMNRVTYVCNDVISKANPFCVLMNVYEKAFRKFSWRGSCFIPSVTPCMPL